MFEFLLVNHPLDCPVCDKGGECPLQDFSYSFGPGDSRMDFPRRVFDGEGVKADVDFGPTLMLNRNRCILCTRCVRFMKEIDGDAQIAIVDRGNGSEIATFQEEGVHSILSGNLMDVCPVGAITTRDYRFKSRPWDNPDAVDTICTLCSKGCNTTAWIKAKPEWAKGARLIRFTPRLNHEVNGYWMCDIGRFDYHWIEGEDRLQKPLRARRLGDAAAGHVGAGARPTARRAQARRVHLPGLGAREQRGTVPRPAPRRPDRARLAASREAAAGAGEVPRAAASDAPNVNGARDLGLPVGPGNDGAPDLSALRAEVEAGRVAALYVFDPGPEGTLGDVVVARRPPSSRAACRCSSIRACSPTTSSRAADIVLPGSAWVEKDGTYTNDQGRVQAASRVFAAPGDALDDRDVFLRVARALGQALPYQSAAEVRAAIGEALAGNPGLRGDRRRSRSGVRWPPARGCRDRTRRSAGSGTSCSRTCRR